METALAQRFVLASQHKPFRLLFVTPQYLPHVGGTEIHTYEVANRLTQAGYDITILTTDLEARLPAIEHAPEASIIRVPGWPRQRDYYFAPAIYRIIAEGDWSLIHCQGYHTFVAPIAMLAAIRSHVPFVVTFHSGGHSSHIRTALRGLQRTLLRPLLARSDRLIAVSEFEATFFHERLGLPRDRFVVISNGTYLPPTRPAITPTSGGPIIVSVGRLERYKGHHRIVKALPYITRQYPNVQLRILGSGPYEATLRRLAREQGVSDRVDIRVVPPKDREGMAQVLAGASLVILLSDYESQGMAVLEALALGRPVLVTDTSALHTLADEGLLRATPLGSTAYEVADAVVRELRDPLIHSSINLPTWDICVEALQDVYAGVRSKRGEGLNGK